MLNRSRRSYRASRLIDIQNERSQLIERLFRLPYDIRVVIWKHYFQGRLFFLRRNSAYVTQEPAADDLPKSMSVLLVSKGIRSEALPLFYSTCIFELNWVYALPLYEPRVIDTLGRIRNVIMQPFSILLVFGRFGGSNEHAWESFRSVFSSMRSLFFRVTVDPQTGPSIVNNWLDQGEVHKLMESMKRNINGKDRSLRIHVDVTGSVDKWNTFQKHKCWCLDFTLYPEGQIRDWTPKRDSKDELEYSTAVKNVLDSLDLPNRLSNIEHGEKRQYAFA